MPRRPTLSPSKLACYLACPHRYYWTYESDKGQWFLRARSYFSFGLSLHRTLEEFHRGREVGVPTAEQILSTYDEKWIDAGYGSAEDMANAYGEGKEILQRIAEEEAAAPLAGTVLQIEKSLRKAMGEWDLVGRADRIDELEDGTICVVDYKSGRSHVDEEQIAKDIAMGAYALMTRDLYPDRQVAATIHALRSGEKATHRFSNEELDEFAFAVQELGDRIRNHHWEEFLPQPKPLCAGCDFLSLCRKVPAYAEAEAVNL